ncbi:MAG: DUF433 domain-containing protein [Chloroflexi bacterium]|nr:DUF433 domain-containing protein [Chloroflexota bacterium]
MQIDDYFVFLAPNDIRIRGTRVGIETVLHDYLTEGKRPEEIAASYSTLELEQVYATILYYLHNLETVSQYMAEWYDFGRRMREEQARNPSPAVARFRGLLAEREVSVRRES